MLQLGQACNVSSDPVRIPAGKAILSDKNNLGLSAGAKIRIKTASHTFFASIVSASKDCQHGLKCIAEVHPLSRGLIGLSHPSLRGARITRSFKT